MCGCVSSNYHLDDVVSCRHSAETAMATNRAYNPSGMFANGDTIDWQLKLTPRPNPIADRVASDELRSDSSNSLRTTEK